MSETWVAYQTLPAGELITIPHWYAYLYEKCLKAMTIQYLNRHRFQTLLGRAVYVSNKSNTFTSVVSFINASLLNYIMLYLETQYVNCVSRHTDGLWGCLSSAGHRKEIVGSVLCQADSSILYLRHCRVCKIFTFHWYK